MSDIVYDVPIGEVAKILDKSDRQVRRYVKAERLGARPVRINGHIKLMFNREEVVRFGGNAAQGGVFGESGHEVVADTRVVEEARGATEARQDMDVSAIDSTQASGSDAVKYVIDTLRAQIETLRTENRELHYQLEQRSGQVGFLQGKIEILQEEIKMLAPAPQSQEEIVKRKPWYRRMFGRE